MACSHADPLAPCRDLGPAGFSATAPRCDDPRCQACVAGLRTLWNDRADRANATRFRAHFLGVGSDARDAFVRAARPGAPYTFEHCMASPRRGAACAAWSSVCVEGVAAALASSNTSLAERRQATHAAAQVCPSTRAALVEAMLRDARGPCEESACAPRVAAHLAAATVLAPHDDDGGEALRAMVRATPENVARAIVEALGAPDAPADIDALVVQRTLRAYCFAIVAASATAPPFACGAVMTRFLTHDEFADAPQAWDALRAASPTVRRAVLDGALLDVCRAPAQPAQWGAHLDTLPRDETREAVLRAMQSPATTDPAWTALRAWLARSGVTGAALPPVNRPSVPAAPVDETSPPRTGASPTIRAPLWMPSREG